MGVDSSVFEVGIGSELLSDSSADDGGSDDFIQLVSLQDVRHRSAALEGERVITGQWG